MITRIALAQVSASQDFESNLQKAETFMRKASECNAHIICFPEMGFIRFFPQYRTEKRYFDVAEPVPGPTVERMQKLAQKYSIVTIINIFEREGPGQYYNTSPLIDSDGSLLGKAQMMHIAEEPMFNEKYYYTPGKTGFPVFRTKAGLIGIAICYDRHFPEQMRALTLQGAEIVFIPQAGVTGNPVEMYETEMQAASFSNQIFIALVNRVGIEDKLEFVGGSFATDPSGTIIARAGVEKEELLVAECDVSFIDTIRRERPFIRDRRPELYTILHQM